MEPQLAAVESHGALYITESVSADKAWLRNVICLVCGAAPRVCSKLASEPYKKSLSVGFLLE